MRLSDLSENLRVKFKQSVGTQMQSDCNILAFTFQFILFASCGLNIRTSLLHPKKKQLTINMCKTFKMKASLNFDLFELYLILHQMNLSFYLVQVGYSFLLAVRGSRRGSLRFLLSLDSLWKIALNSFNYLCAKQPTF